MFKTILLPTDGSPNARAATEMAFDLAKATDASVFVSYIVEFLPAYGRAGAPWILGQGVKREEMIARGESVVEAVTGLADERGIECKTTVTSGVPQQLIVEQAKRVDADVIVMGKTDRRGVSERLWGSTADRVVMRATVPVLLVSEADLASTG